ncbi:MAG: ASPIC/UnbV domain-containing protein [Cyclobacteriaceae bacterium]
MSSPLSLYKNKKNTKNWIKIKLQGTRSNRSAIGAKVKIFSQGKWQMRELSAQSGYNSQNSLIAHFGIGTATTVDSLVVQWPSGIRQVQANIAAKRLVKVVEVNPAPEYVTSPANGTVNTNVSLKVTSSTLKGASTYTIELSPDQTFSTGIISMSGTNALNFTGLSYSTTYYARVKSNLSPLYGKTTNFSTAPAEYFSYVKNPVNNATGVATSLNVVVNTVIGATNYTVELNSDSAFNATTALVQTGAKTTFMYSGLHYNTVYHTRVKTDLSPNWGVIKSFTTKRAQSYITAPINNSVNVPYVTNVSTNTILGATLYTIELNPDSTFNATTAIVKYSSNHTIGFTLAYNTKYYGRVSTDADPGSWGVTKVFTTGDPLSLAYVTSPKNGSSGVPTSVSITSNVVPGATHYTIELNTASDFSGTPIVRSGMRTISFSGLAMNTTYHTRVQSNLAPGQWGITNTTFTTASPGARSTDWKGDDEEETLEFGAPVLSVYPNPVKTTFTVHAQTDNQDVLSIQLYDMTGKELNRYQGQTNNLLEIDGRSLVGGMYIIRVATSHGVDVRKIVKIEP